MIPEFIAEVQISYSSHVKAKDRLKVSGSSDAASAFRSIWPAYDHIEFSYMLMMNRQNQILGYHQLSKGGMTGAVVDVRVIFQVALKACATSLILAHYAKRIVMQSDVDNTFYFKEYMKNYFT
jgi:DNA repair protein RadC